MRMLIFAVLLTSMLGCSKAQPPPKAPAPDWANPDAKIMACLDLQDHVVDLYAMAYVMDNGVPLEQFKDFRDQWAEALARQGTFERFEASCFSSLTRAEYECAIDARSTSSFVACMKLSGRGTPKLADPVIDSAKKAKR